MRSGVAHFCPATPESREARRGANSVRAIFRIHRQITNFEPMVHKALNTNLHSARTAKTDEFYTQLVDIEKGV